MKASSKNRILLVEDDFLARTVSAAILSDAGYEVLEASDGLEAWSVLSKATPNLVLSDVRMPRCTGLQLLQKIRADPSTAALPFIIASAADKPSDHRLGMSFGADDYLIKPFEPADLLQSVAFRLARLSAVPTATSHRYQSSAPTLPVEIRGHLVGVLGYAELILNAAETDTPLQRSQLLEYGHGIRRAGWHLLEISKDFALLADLSQLREPNESAGDRILDVEIVDCLSAEKHLRRYAAEMGRADDLHIKVENAAINVPQIGLHRVCQHLVANALKFSLPGQSVNVRGRIIENRYHLSVADQGRGMSTQQIGEILRDQSTDWRHLELNGIGMGLSLARRFAHMGSGLLTLTPNTPAPGITITLVLPVHSEAIPGALSEKPV